MRPWRQSAVADNGADVVNSPELWAVLTVRFQWSKHLPAQNVRVLIQRKEGCSAEDPLVQGQMTGEHSCIMAIISWREAYADAAAGKHASL